PAAGIVVATARGDDGSECQHDTHETMTLDQGVSPWCEVSTHLLTDTLYNRQNEGSTRHPGGPGDAAPARPGVDSAGRPDPPTAARGRVRRHPPAHHHR